MVSKISFLKSNLFLIVPILFGAFLYFFNLSRIPSGFYSDEAVVGYNAYSILKTGRDEYGQLFPVYFKFFGSYTPGLFVYFLIPFIKIFGLSINTIRGVNALLMLSTGIILIAFIRQIIPSFSKLNQLISLSLYYITPWTVFNARLGYETTFAYFIFCLTAYFLLLSLKNPRYLLVAFSLISLSTYAAHPYRLLAPLLILAYIIIFRPNLKKILPPLLLAILIQIPNLILFFTPSFWVKGSYLNLHFINQYLTFFSPYFLFSSPDPDPQRSIPQLSVFYFWQIIPILIGLIYFYQHRSLPSSRLLFLLLLLAPLPSAMANANFATQRSLALLFPYSIAAAISFIYLKSKISYLLTSLVFIFSLVLLFRSYFIFLPQLRIRDWYGGFDQMTAFINNHPEYNYVIDDSRHIPHIEYLFFSQYPPAKYQSEMIPLSNYYSQTTFIAHRRFANLDIRPIVWRDDVYKDLVIIGPPQSFSDQQINEHCLKKVFETTDYQNKPLFTGYQTDPDKKRQGCQ